MHAPAQYPASKPTHSVCRSSPGARSRRFVRPGPPTPARPLPRPRPHPHPHPAFIAPSHSPSFPTLLMSPCSVPPPPCSRTRSPPTIHPGCRSRDAAHFTALSSRPHADTQYLPWTPPPPPLYVPTRVRNCTAPSSPAWPPPSHPRPHLCLPTPHLHPPRPAPPNIKTAGHFLPLPPTYLPTHACVPVLLGLPSADASAASYPAPQSFFPAPNIHQPISFPTQHSLLRSFPPPTHPPPSPRFTTSPPATLALAGTAEAACGTI